MVIVPLSQTASQRLYTVLDDQACTLALYWRQERLYLDLSVGSILICQGAICQDRASIVQSPSRDFSGSLHFVDMEGASPPRWNGLYTGRAGRWVLVYVPDGEELPEGLRY